MSTPRSPPHLGDWPWPPRLRPQASSPRPQHPPPSGQQVGSPAELLGAEVTERGRPGLDGRAYFLRRKNTNKFQALQLFQEGEAPSSLGPFGFFLLFQ